MTKETSTHEESKAEQNVSVTEAPQSSNSSSRTIIPSAVNKIYEGYNGGFCQIHVSSQWSELWGAIFIDVNGKCIKSSATQILTGAHPTQYEKLYEHLRLLVAQAGYYVPPKVYENIYPVLQQELNEFKDNICRM